MSLFLALLGVTMMVSGLAAIYSGSLFVGIERGWTMVVSGTVAFSAGAILLGLAAALRRLRRIERATKRLVGVFGGHPPVIVDVQAEAPAGAGPEPAPAGSAVRPAAEDSAAETGGSEETGASDEPRSDKVVGTYKAGGNAYVMYADGSIRAETPSGEHRFASMEEFKAFMLTGTMRARAPEEPDKIAPPDAGAQASDKPTALSANA